MHQAHNFEGLEEHRVLDWEPEMEPIEATEVLLTMSAYGVHDKSLNPTPM